VAAQFFGILHLGPRYIRIPHRFFSRIVDLFEARLTYCKGTENTAGVVVVVFGENELRQPCAIFPTKHAFVMQLMRVDLF
jgi:hypothetical protein